MHGPYAAEISIRRVDGSRETVEFSDLDLARDAETVATASRFYSRVGGTTAQDVETLGVFAAAALLDSGDEAEVSLVGFVGKGESYGGTTSGRVALRVNRVRRDDRGRAITTLGSRFRERIFRGI